MSGISSLNSCDTNGFGDFGSDDVSGTSSSCTGASSDDQDSGKSLQAAATLVSALGADKGSGSSGGSQLSGNPLGVGGGGGSASALSGNPLGVGSSGGN